MKLASNLQYNAIQYSVSQLNTIADQLNIYIAYDLAWQKITLADWQLGNTGIITIPPKSCIFNYFATVLITTL